MRRSRQVVLVTTLLLPLGLVLATSEEKKPSRETAERTASAAGETEDEADVDAPMRFTNEDLKSVRLQDMYPDPDDDEAEGGEGNESEEAAWTLDDEMAGFSEEALKKTIDETRLAIVELEFHLEHLKKRRLSVLNPLLRAVTPPTREEEEDVGGLSNPERLGWVDDQIVATESELDETREEMASLLRR
jgi:hypothetical protein